MLGVRYSQLWNALRNDRFPAPPRNSSGAYIWSPKDIEAARKGLANDRRRNRRKEAV
jgi:hypothetical protein